MYILIHLMTMARLKLGSDEQSFLRGVTRAIIANPFSDERRAADADLFGIAPSATQAERDEVITGRIAAGVAHLAAAGRTDITRFAGEERVLLENALLYDAYNRYYFDFDRLIEEQTRAGEESCRVPFAEDALRRLTGCGFNRHEALHYFAVFFQMRRAYYFIDRSIIGRSSSMKELRLNLWNNVFTFDIGLYARGIWSRMEDYSTLLLGETGTGKGVSASAIGRSGYIPFDESRQRFSESFTRAFVSMNLSQFPEPLIESELFGHRKGSFTGAVADQEGVFARCSPHGAIFLDEIGEVSVPVQIKLLEVLQGRCFSAVGSHERKRFAGRVIAATNQPLDRLRAEKGFRDDFYYRLCSDIITVPPLRRRIQEDPEELGDLIRHTLDRIVGLPSPGLFEKVSAAVAAQVPRDYPWPGNVRELEQCVRRILIKQRYEIDRSGLNRGDETDCFLEGVKSGTLAAEGLLSGYCRMLYRRYGTYEAVAQKTGLDRRTVKRYLGLSAGPLP